MMTVIVDTNVAVVANGRAEQASEECVETCIDRLLQINSGEVKLALDDQRRIIQEYRQNLSPDGQPYRRRISQMGRDELGKPATV